LLFSFGCPIFELSSKQQLNKQIMTTAQITIGTKIVTTYGTLEVTSLHKGYCKGNLILKGRVVDNATTFCFDMLNNPHYNKDITFA
jgi:hypothetical protein